MDQNGTWAGAGAPNSPAADGAPPAERRDLPHAGTQAERGKPVGVPKGGNGRVSDRDAPAGTGRRKKRRPCGNRTERECNIIPRASGQTAVGSLSPRAWGEPVKEAQHLTVAGAAGAASHVSKDWHHSHWGTVHRNVRRLQARIVQATKAGRGGKGQAVQYLLPHSWSGRALAGKRVTEHHGNRPPGVEGETWPHVCVL